jgi:hypothetical protein
VGRRRSQGTEAGFVLFFHMPIDSMAGVYVPKCIGNVAGFKPSTIADLKQTKPGLV